MEKINLNVKYSQINVYLLKCGTHDFNVKIGRTVKTVRIVKDSIDFSVAVYDSLRVENGKCQGILFFPNSCAPCINRKFIENFKILCMSVQNLSRFGCRNVKII